MSLAFRSRDVRVRGENPDEAFFAREMHRLVAVALACWVIVGLAGCRSDTVRVAFRPSVGARFRYQVEVSKTRMIRLGLAAPQRTVDHARLEADETVLASGPGGVRVNVELRRAGSAARHFVVLFDRAAQLTAVESIEGLPAAILEPFGLSEIFPAAAGAPPARPLGAGERWTIDDQLQLVGSAPVRLRGDGHLVRLGVVGGRKVASINTVTNLPVTSSTDLQGGHVTLTGVEHTASDATRDLLDGAVEQAGSTTTGSYRVELAPSGSQGAPVVGTMTIEVRSKTHRLRSD